MTCTRKRSAISLLVFFWIFSLNAAAQIGSAIAETYSYIAPECPGQKPKLWIEQRLKNDAAYIKFNGEALSPGFNFVKLVTGDPEEDIPLLWMDFNGDGRCDFLAQQFIQGAQYGWHYFMFFRQKESGEFEMVYVSPGIQGYAPDSIQVIYAHSKSKPYLLLLRDTEINSCGSVVQWADEQKKFVRIAPATEADIVNFYKKTPQLAAPLFMGCQSTLQ